MHALRLLSRWSPALGLLALSLGAADAAAGSLTTLFSGGNSQNGNMFTIDAAIGLRVDALTLHMGSSCTTGWEVYTTTATLNSATAANSALWTRVGSGSGTYTSGSQPTISLSAPPVLATGSSLSFYITLTNTSCYLNYTDGSSLGAVYTSNGELSIRQGYGVAYPFSTLFSPRVWNGTIDYTTCPGGVAVSGFADVDGDGYGDPGSPRSVCAGELGVVTNDDDCDDGDAARSPGSAEACDGLDNDCDGAVDEAGALGELTYYIDVDGDSYGDLAGMACDLPAGASLVGGDCDDGDSAVSPAAIEACDGIDNDCDGAADEAGALGELAWFFDGDSDGFGGASAGLSCAAPVGAVGNASDCDDLDGAVNPDADEVCNLIDDDCDGVVDGPSSLDLITYFVDADLDGYGSALTVQACGPDAGRTLSAGDCNDALSDVNPGEVERCITPFDDDCDGAVNEGSAVDARPYYADGDRDGYGDPAALTLACIAPAFSVTDNTDCDDGRALTNPGAAETCNGIDDDCDAVIDEPDAVDAATWYQDADGDGFGTSGGGLLSSQRACAAPAGYTASNDDCDDAALAVNPAAAELCNLIDDNCDGVVDLDAADRTMAYRDADADGFGDPATGQLECALPSGFVADSSDCDDGRDFVAPGAPERCDGLDDDCDGLVPADEIDDDGDTFVECLEDSLGWQAEPAGFGDCDDADPAIYPGAEELAYDGIDQDCSGSDRCDDDEDGFDAADCGGDDCDDANAAVNPEAAERYYDGVDDNCAPEDDDDMDGDGYASASYGGEDCDDANPDAYPGAPDLPYDGLVTDCDSSDENDADGDGFDATAAGGSDCDDANGSVYPGATESWYDGVDEDCDGNDDDQDGDGYALSDDCDDTDPVSYPGAPGLNEDCSPDQGGGGDGADGAPELDTGGLTADEADLPAGKFEGGNGGCASAPAPKLAPAGLLGALGLLLGLRRRR